MTNAYTLAFALIFIMPCILAKYDSYYCSWVPGYFSCETCECCDNHWVQKDIGGLQNELSSELFGQHIAKDVVVRALKGFLSNSRPSKALAMSFNGLTGSGKTFMSRLIANHLYKRGVESKFVHIYIANKDFPHLHKVSQYQDRIRSDIIRYTKECGRSLFIFEEVEKMPPGTIDSLKPFLDFHDSIDGVDFRKNIFIFLSNSGSQSIVDKILEFWKDGKDREDITLNDIDDLVVRGSFNEKGGFQYSEVLSSALVDFFIPFLPLERKHVEQCISAELAKGNHYESSTIVKRIADSLVYFPDETNLFSSTGCKRIQHKVAVFF